MYEWQSSQRVEGGLAWWDGWAEERVVTGDGRKDGWMDGGGGGRSACEWLFYAEDRRLLRWLDPLPWDPAVCQLTPLRFAVGLWPQRASLARGWSHWSVRNLLLSNLLPEMPLHTAICPRMKAAGFERPMRVRCWMGSSHIILYSNNSSTERAKPQQLEFPKQKKKRSWPEFWHGREGAVDLASLFLLTCCDLSCLHWLDGTDTRDSVACIGCSLALNVLSDG